MENLIEIIKSFLDVLSRITINNIFDILFLSLILFFIFKSIRKTKGEQLLKGFILILLVMKLSDFFGFTAVAWILQNSFEFLVIAFIVSFQQELRKILEKAGQSTNIPKRKTSSNDSLQIINILEKAVYKLSSTHTGALIVIARNDILSDYLDNSTPLDSLISIGIIENIFIKDTPLHDGAIIIQNNRILASNCVLPLTSKELAPEFGTRHRAGIGVTECTDAVCIVVSEESGKVSICVDGNLVAYSDRLLFKKTLQELMSLTDRTRKGEKNINDKK